MADTPDPAVLAEAIKDLSDEELDSTLKQMGVDEVLANIFTGMQAAFIPEKAQGVSCAIQYDIKANGEVKHYGVAFDNGECQTSPGPAASPRLTLELGLVDFVRLIFNQVEGPQLFMTGRLRLKGDMMFAMQMQSFFARDF